MGSLARYSGHVPDTLPSLIMYHTIGSPSYLLDADVGLQPRSSLLALPPCWSGATAYANRLYFDPLLLKEGKRKRRCETTETKLCAMRRWESRAGS